MNPVILIVAPPGDLQIGLQALITSHLEVDVLVTSEVSAAISVIKIHNPVLLILDQDLPGNSVLAIIQDVKSTWPNIGCMILAKDALRRSEFEEIGTDLVVIKGLPGAKLVAEIKKLLAKNSPP